MEKVSDQSNRDALAEKKNFGMLDKYSKLLDSSIKIPGTNKTIGVDPIVGLIPGVGPVAGYGFSILLIYNMVKHGASKRLVMKMMGNIFLDTTIGLIPVAGTIFDFAYKSNDRNVKMFREYHDEGMHRESAMPIFLAMLAISVLFLCTVVWLTWWIFSTMGDAMMSLFGG